VLNVGWLFRRILDYNLDQVIVPNSAPSPYWINAVLKWHHGTKSKALKPTLHFHHFEYLPN